MKGNTKRTVVIAIAVVIALAIIVPIISGTASEIVGGRADLRAAYLNDNSNIATTSVVYLTAGAATTTSSIISYDAKFADLIDYNIMVTASTTSTTRLQWTNEFSNNNIDWTQEDCSTVDNDVSITHGATACLHQWTPATTTSFKNVSVTPVASRYVRTQYTLTGANGALWVQVVRKEQRPN